MYQANSFNTRKCFVTACRVIFVPSANCEIECERLLVSLETRDNLDTFDFTVIPGLNKSLALELMRSEWIEKHENVIALGPSSVGKTHMSLALGLAACQKGLSVVFKTAAALVHELMEARDQKRLRLLQKQLANTKLLIINELGYVPFTVVGAELLFEVFSHP